MSTRSMRQEQVDLLCLYGTQLQNIGEIHAGVPEELLREISKHCPNAAICSDIYFRDQASIVSILGSQIEVLAVCISRLENDLVSFH